MERRVSALLRRAPSECVYLSSKEPTSWCPFARPPAGVTVPRLIQKQVHGKLRVFRTEQPTENEQRALVQGATHTAVRVPDDSWQ